MHTTGRVHSAAPAATNTRRVPSRREGLAVTRLSHGPQSHVKAAPATVSNDTEAPENVGDRDVGARVVGDPVGGLVSPALVGDGVRAS